MYPFRMPIASVTSVQPNMPVQTLVGCSCGVFLSGQFAKGSHKPPVGYPAMIEELDGRFACNRAGAKSCKNKCLTHLMKHLSKSQELICSLIDRDCFKERAYLFVKNCNSPWSNTNLAAGKKYCCKNNEFYKCPTFLY